MMASASSKSSSLECPVCCDTVRDPRTLPCGHTLCGVDCLPEMINRVGNSTLSCPVCRATCSIPRGGFQKNIMLADIIAGMVAQNQQSRRQLPLVRQATRVPVASCVMCDHRIADGHSSMCADCVFTVAGSDAGRHSRAYSHPHGLGSVAAAGPDPQLRPPEQGILLIDGLNIEFYSPTTNTSNLLDIPLAVDYNGPMIGALNTNQVLVVERGVFPSRQTVTVDLVYNRTRTGPPVTNARSGACSATIDGDMYICGDRTCEVLSSGKDGWLRLSDMTTSRSRHAVAALNGRLYALGGGISFEELSSVECYSPGTNSWRNVAPMAYKRSHLAAASLNGSLYACGGEIEQKQRCSPPNQDEERSVTKELKNCDPARNRWQRVADLNVERSGFALVAFGNKLYALGGSGERTVESYNPLFDEWTMEPIRLKSSQSSGVVATLSGTQVFKPKPEGACVIM